MSLKIRIASIVLLLIAVTALMTGAFSVGRYTHFIPVGDRDRAEKPVYLTEVYRGYESVGMACRGQRPTWNLRRCTDEVYAVNRDLFRSGSLGPRAPLVIPGTLSKTR